MTAFEFEASGERIERLLAELSSASSPHQWAKIEQLMQMVNQVYGEGLRRIVAAIGDRTDPGELLARLASDDLVSALLTLHDLNPLTPRQRLERALDRVRPQLASHSGGVEILDLHDDGSLELVLVGTCGSCGASHETIETALRAAVLDSGCEISQVDVWERARDTDPPPGRPLIQLRLRRDEAVPG